MTKFSKEMIISYAGKLLIGLTDEETETLLNEFDVIEKNMDLINKIDNISEVDVMNYPFIMDMSPRDGKEIVNDNVDDLLKNCDKVSDTEIEVPKVVG